MKVPTIAETRPPTARLQSGVIGEMLTAHGASATAAPLGIRGCGLLFDTSTLDRRHP